MVICLVLGVSLLGTATAEPPQAVALADPCYIIDWSTNPPQTHVNPDCVGQTPH